MYRKETFEVGIPPNSSFLYAHSCSLRKLRAASQKLAELREHEQRWMLRAAHCHTCQFCHFMSFLCDLIMTYNILDLVLQPITWTVEQISTTWACCSCSYWLQAVRCWPGRCKEHFLLQPHLIYLNLKLLIAFINFANTFGTCLISFIQFWTSLANKMQCRTTGLTAWDTICCRSSFWILSAFLYPFTVLHFICQTALVEVLKDSFL